MTDIQIINPLSYPNWDDLVLSTPDYSFFHSSAWAGVLSESYNYQPLYFTIIQDGKLIAVIPLMEINSFLTGKRGVSLPFTDECHPIAQESGQFRELLQHIFACGKKASWKHIEFHGGHNSFSTAPAYTSYYSHTIDLDQDDAKVFSALKNNVKRNIKRAQEEDVRVTLSNSWESVKAFHKLNCMTRKQHGLPPQPLSFFRKVFAHIVSPKKGFVAQALFKMNSVAAAIFFHFGNQAIYKYGASDRKYLNLRPNNLVMWEAIRWYCKNGYKTFSLGRTEPQNHGLLQFKRGWGSREHKLSYYKYDLKRDCFVSQDRGFKTSYIFFRHMPSPLLRLTGNLFYRHVG